MDIPLTKTQPRLRLCLLRCDAVTFVARNCSISTRPDQARGLKLPGFWVVKQGNAQHGKCGEQGKDIKRGGRRYLHDGASPVAHRPHEDRGGEDPDDEIGED